MYLDPLQQVGVMSIGFLLDSSDTPVVWRGPKKNGGSKLKSSLVGSSILQLNIIFRTAMIKQFVSDVYWQELDYLIIDTPPGTSDEHISVCEALREYSPDGAAANWQHLTKNICCIKT